MSDSAKSWHVHKVLVTQKWEKGIPEIVTLKNTATLQKQKREFLIGHLKKDITSNKKDSKKFTNLEHSVEKHVSTGVLNTVLGRTNFTLSPTVSHKKNYEQTNEGCLGEYAPTHPSTRQFCLPR